MATIPIAIGEELREPIGTRTGQPVYDETQVSVALMVSPTLAALLVGSCSCNVSPTAMEYAILVAVMMALATPAAKVMLAMVCTKLETRWTLSVMTALELGGVAQNVTHVKLAGMVMAVTTGTYKDCPVNEGMEKLSGTLLTPSVVRDVEKLDKSDKLAVLDRHAPADAIAASADA